MTKEEFDAIVDDAVKNGATRAEAEAYVRSGFKLGEAEISALAEAEETDEAEGSDAADVPVKNPFDDKGRK